MPREHLRIPESVTAHPLPAAEAEIMLHEQRWLPLLAPRLPLPIPSPERTGVPAHGYPYSWSVVPFLPGKPATDTFRSAYERAGGLGASDDAVWRRAQGWALNLGLVFLAYPADNPQLLEVGRRTLDRIA
jgi:hypothetical protein